MAASGWLIPVMLVALKACVQADDTYIEPKIFDGVLIVSTCQSLSQQQSELLAAEFQVSQTPTSLVIITDNQLEIADSLENLRKLKWRDEPQQLDVVASSAEELSRQLGKTAAGDCLWISANLLSKHAAKLKTAVTDCLARGVIVFVEAAHVEAGQRIDGGLSWLPDMELVRANSRKDDAPRVIGSGQAGAGLVRVSVPDDCWLRIGGRAIINLSLESSTDCNLYWPATKFYQEPKEQRLPAGTVADLVTYRRAWHERQQPEFPTDVAYQPRLDKGSLVIVGGGQTSPEIWQKFVDLAGGKDSRIVVLPTAMPEPTIADADEKQIFERYGAGEVRVLPQIDRAAVSSPEYLEQLRWATGVWFGGGRQWRFVDAYWGTPAWQELKQVTQRGGVIGGSSAGATIQGDLLVRGHPLGNQIMVADGYRRGLGLLSGVAIDQHFRQRNRFDDLSAVVERFPKIIGIGIDEGTALVVQPTAKCQVLGQGSVWLTTPSHRAYIEYEHGSEFSLF